MLGKENYPKFPDHPVNWATKVANKVHNMTNNIINKMLAEESAEKKLGYSDLQNKNGGSKTLISVDGKVSVYFEKRTGDDVRFICRIIRKGPQDIIKKSKSLNLIVTEVKKYFPTFPDFEKPKDIPFVPEGMDINSFFRLEYIARIYNVTSQELCDWVLEHYIPPAKLSNTPIEEFMEVYKRDGLTRGLRPDSLKNAVFQFREYCKYEKIKTPKDISTENLDDFYNHKKHGGLAYKKRINPILNFMVKNKYLAKNPNEETRITISPPPRSNSAFILRVDAANALMRYAESESNPRVRAVFALMLFAGVRPQEVNYKKFGKKYSDLNNGRSDTESMRWKDIDVEERIITIRGDVSKNYRTNTSIVGLPDNFWAWIEAVPERVRKANEGNNRIGFSTAVLQKYRKKAAAFLTKYVLSDSQRDKNLRKTCKLESDIMRHSFCTYGSHYSKIGPHNVLKIARHSAAVDNKYYQGVIVKKEEAENYFNIYPSTYTGENAYRPPLESQEAALAEKITQDILKDPKIAAIEIADMNCELSDEELACEFTNMA